MESIKETELNLQREKVTSVANTWLVKAVNPSTGEEKMIDVSNFSSVVAGLVFPNFKTKAISSTNTSLKDIVEKDILSAYPSILGFVCGVISNASGTHNYWGHLYKSGSYYYGTINIQLLGEKTIHTLTLNKSVATE